MTRCCFHFFYWAVQGKHYQRSRNQFNNYPVTGRAPDGTKIEIESAMLSADNWSLNICIVPV
jgi:hypothetical protein